MAGAARVFLGALAGNASPVRTFTPMLGAELLIAPHARVTLTVDTGFEHGVLVDQGSIRLGETAVLGAELVTSAPATTP